MSINILWAVSLAFSGINAKSGGEYYPSSCADLPDGQHSLKLLEGSDYPVITVECSNGYMILDYSLDSDISYYFSSWDNWYRSYFGPSNDERINWEEWFLPSKYSEPAFEFDFLTSPDCDSCDISEDMNSVYGGKSTYWFSGNLFGCFWAVIGSPNFEQSWETEKCNYYSGEADAYTVGIARDDEKTQIDDYSKDAASTNSMALTGTCAHQIRASDYFVVTEHGDCAQDGTVHAKPAIGTNGKYCICAKPKESQLDTQTKRFHYAEHPLSEKALNDHTPKSMLKSQDSSSDDIIELWQSDFESGTYRITEPGTYKIMEDITFDFVGNSLDSDSIEDLWLHPNSGSYYWPDSEDNLNNEYPGAGEYKGPFSEGWFAGISIESNDVILDLNEKELKQSDVFYYQQRWFSILELCNQQFIPGQGPYNAGPNPIFPENIVIKNGILGLSSHHGIHGNGNKNVWIDNVEIKNFETHGIQLNGFDTVKLTNIEVGPTSNKVLLNGRYAHGRALINRYRTVAEKDIEENGVATKTKFFGRPEPVTMSDIVDEMELELDYALRHVMSMDDDDDTDTIPYKKAMETFINQLASSGDEDYGVPLGSAQYGIFLNTYGASILTYNLYISAETRSSNAYLENIKIHGMKHSMYKVHVLLDESGLQKDSLGMGIDAESFYNNWGDWENEELGYSYKGNVLTDAAILAEELSNDFSLLSNQLIESALRGFAQGVYNGKVATEVNMFCNSDTMFHSGKGTQGLRIDAVDSVYVKNIEIYDNHDYTSLETAGACDGTSTYYTMCFKDENIGSGCSQKKRMEVFARQHSFQNEPMQTGFSGNMNQGININAATSVVIEDVYIHDLSSKTGPVFGISVWPADDVKLQGNIVISDLEAGYDIKENELSYDDYPNRAPEVCAIRNYESYDEFVSVIDYNDATLSTSNLKGHVGCLGDTDSNSNLDIEVNVIVDSNEKDDFGRIESKHKSKKTKGKHGSSSAKVNITVGTAVGVIALICVSVLLYLFCCKTPKSFEKVFDNCKTNVVPVSEKKPLLVA